MRKKILVLTVFTLLVVSQVSAFGADGTGEKTYEEPPEPEPVDTGNKMTGNFFGDSGNFLKPVTDAVEGFTSFIGDLF